MTWDSGRPRDNRPIQWNPGPRNPLENALLDMKWILADRGLARNGGALKIFNNQMDDTGDACQQLTTPSGMALTFINFCQDLSNTDSPSDATSSTGQGHCECPWNSDLVEERDFIGTISWVVSG